MDLLATAQKWRDAAQIRAELTKKIDELKKLEAELKGEILNHLAAQGQSGVKLENFGTVTRTTKTKMTAVDTNKLCEFMFDQMQSIVVGNTASTDGSLPTPLESARLFQSQVFQGGVEAHLATRNLPSWDDKVKYCEEVMGIRLWTENDLSFTKLPKPKGLKGE